MIDGSGFLAVSVEVAFVLVMASIVLGFFRLARGPSLADRVVAIDMMTVSIVAFCALFAIWVDDATFLDVAIVLALVGFLSTVALARFAERRVVDEDRDPTEELGSWQDLASNRGPEALDGPGPVHSAVGIAEQVRPSARPAMPQAGKRGVMLPELPLQAAGPAPSAPGPEEDRNG